MMVEGEPGVPGMLAGVSVLGLDGGEQASVVAEVPMISFALSSC